MPLYDGYLNKTWLIPPAEYFAMHGLDPAKKLIAYAATALSISPNLHIIEELTRIITEKKLSVPAQLLIRLHPNHFKSQRHYQEEREKIYELTRGCADVHVVAPKALAGGLPRYSGEDFPEKRRCWRIAMCWSRSIRPWCWKLPSMISQPSAPVSICRPAGKITTGSRCAMFLLADRGAGQRAWRRIERFQR